MKKLAQIAILTLGLALSFLGITNNAQASTLLVDCQPRLISLDFFGAPSSSRMSIICNADGRTYWTNPNSSCTSRSLDVVKAWETLATSALLSGKHLNVWFTSCGVDRSIDSLELAN